VVRVVSYDTNEPLEGVPSPTLVRESGYAYPTGGVSAYCENGVWQYVAGSRVEDYRRMGCDVVTVYVEGA
jgi:hypothetical protein